MRALDGSVICDECLGSGLVACWCPVCTYRDLGQCPRLGQVRCDCKAPPVELSEFHELLKEEA